MCHNAGSAYLMAIEQESTKQKTFVQCWIKADPLNVSCGAHFFLIWLDRCCATLELFLPSQNS